MGDVPTTVNTAADTADSIIHDVIYEVAVNAAITACSAYLPFLKLPIISSLFSFAVNKVAALIYTYLSQFVTFLVIDIQVDSEKTLYAQAEGGLRTAMLTADPAQIAAARAQFKATLGSLIHYDGSSTA